MANPKKLLWAAPTKNTDESVFDQSQFAGFTLYIDGKPGVSVPVGWDADGQYEMDLATMPDLVTYGTHTVAMTVTNKVGAESAKTPAVTYTFADERVPKAPFGLALA